MFLKNKNIIFKIRRSKVADYAALSHNFIVAIESLGDYENHHRINSYRNNVHHQSLSVEM